MHPEVTDITDVMLELLVEEGRMNEEAAREARKQSRSSGRRSSGRRMRRVG